MAKERTYFDVGRRAGHWWFITPDGYPFFSIGMNHIDSATLRYKESGDIWWQKYGNSEKRWIQEGVVPDLRACVQHHAPASVHSHMVERVHHLQRSA